MRVQKLIRKDKLSDLLPMDNQMSFGHIQKPAAKFMLAVVLQLLIWEFSMPIKYGMWLIAKEWMQKIIMGKMASLRILDFL